MATPTNLKIAVVRAKQAGRPVSEICALYGVGRDSIYRWSADKSLLEAAKSQDGGNDSGSESDTEASLISNLSDVAQLEVKLIESAVQMASGIGGIVTGALETVQVEDLSPRLLPSYITAFCKLIEMIQSSHDRQYDLEKLNSVLSGFFKDEQTNSLSGADREHRSFDGERTPL